MVMTHSLRVFRLALFCATIMFTSTTLAWVYPEHRDIALLSVEKLDPEQLAVLEELWQAARSGREQRFCQDAAFSEQNVTPECIDWAALSAIAGDHSCSSLQMLDIAADSNWILTVADVSAQLKVDLERIPNTVPVEQLALTDDFVRDAQGSYASASSRADRVNAIRIADTRLQRADAQYATRAGANNAHFLMARTSTDETGSEYAIATLDAGSELNAIGVYSWFHLSALQKASRLANERLSDSERSDLARSALFDEAFALHFLEDVYASGHIAGTWGDASQRKGTHDFYNQNGLEARTWVGGSASVVLMGDAHMRPEDAELATTAVARSLNQLLDASQGRSKYPLPHHPASSLHAGRL